jgi:hypothetical protein
MKPWLVCLLAVGRAPLASVDVGGSRRLSWPGRVAVSYAPPRGATTRKAPSEGGRPGRGRDTRRALVRAIAGVYCCLLILSSAGRAGAERAEACRPEVIDWIGLASKALSLPIEPVSCPVAVVVVRLRPAGNRPLDVAVARARGGSFRHAGRYGLSPLVDVADFSTLPAGQRRAFDAFAGWVESNEERVTFGVVEAWPRPPAPLPGWVAPAGLAVLLLLGTGLALRRRAGQAPRASQGATTDRLGRGRRLAAAGLVCCLVAAVTLPFVPAEASYHPDTIRDLMLARCGGDSAGVAAVGSVSTVHLYHGFLWHRVLALWVRLDPSLDHLALLLLALYSTLCAALFDALRRYTSTTSAAIAIAGFVVVVDSSLFAPLWQPTLAPELATLLLLAVYAHCASARWFPTFLGVLVVLAAATQVHLEFLFFVPAVAALFVRGRGGFLALSFLAVFLFVAWSLGSPGSLAENLAILSAWEPADLVPRGVQLLPGWAALDAALPAAPLLGVLALHEIVSRRRGSADPAPAPLIGFARWALVSYVLANLAAGLVHEQTRHYWVPAFPSAAVLACRTIDLLVGRWSARARQALATVVCAAALGSRIVSAGPARLEVDRPLSLDELHRLSRALADRGYDAVGASRLVSPSTMLFESFYGGIWLDAPCTDASGAGEGGDDLPRLLLFAAPQGWATRRSMQVSGLAVVPGRSRDIVLLPYRPYVRPDRARACPVASGRDRCRSVEMGRSGAGLERSIPSSSWPAFSLQLPLQEPGPFVAELAVTVPPDGPPRTVIVAPRNNQRQGQTHGRCPGAVLDIEGLGFRRIAENRVELVPDGAERSGTLRVEWPGQHLRDAAGCTRLPLPMVEVDSALLPRLEPFLVGRSP